MIFKVKFKYHKYDERGKIIGTCVEIISEEGAVLPALLEESAINLPDNDLIEQVKEDFHKKVYINRAMGEAVQKVDEMAPILEEVRKTTEKVNEVIELVSGTALDLGDKMYAVEDIVSQIIEKMGWHINDDGEIEDVVSTTDSEVEGGE